VFCDDPDPLHWSSAKKRQRDIVAKSNSTPFETRSIVCFNTKQKHIYVAVKIDIVKNNQISKKDSSDVQTLPQTTTVQLIFRVTDKPMHDYLALDIASLLAKKSFRIIFVIMIIFAKL